MTRANAIATPPVATRPRFPTGTSVPGVGEIRRILRSDANLELYLLKRKGPSSVVMLSLPVGGADDLPNYNQLAAHLASAGLGEIVRFCPRGRLAGLVVSVRGHWLGEEIERRHTLEELYRLLEALIVQACSDAGPFSAALQRDCLWLSGPLWAPRVTSLFIYKSTGGPAILVRTLLETFVWVATGLDVGAVGSKLDDKQFRAWCQVADAHLSQLIVRALHPKTRITSLKKLATECAVAAERSNVSIA